jgi:hypothetical protein
MARLGWTAAGVEGFVVPAPVEAKYFDASTPTPVRLGG